MTLGDPLEASSKMCQASLSVHVNGRQTPMWIKRSWKKILISYNPTIYLTTYFCGEWWVDVDSQHEKRYRKGGSRIDQCSRLVPFRIAVPDFFQRWSEFGISLHPHCRGTLKKTYNLRSLISWLTNKSRLENKINHRWSTFVTKCNRRSQIKN